MTSSERPILFSGPMVRAILEGRKTQTRRVVVPSPGQQREWLTPQLISSVPHGELINGGWQMHHPRAGTRLAGVDVEHNSPFGWVRCPYGAPGDTLWVRETWACYGGDEYLYQRIAENVMYRATWADDPRCPTYSAGEPVGDRRWRPSIHMPRWASRLSLLIKSVRVERLQEISEADAIAEGLSPTVGEYTGPARSEFAALWDSINAKSHPWASNPWVWVVEFERVGGAS